MTHHFTFQARIRGRVLLVRARWVRGLASVLEVECRAVQLGMELAEEQNMEKAIFLSDSREVVWALNLASWREGVNLQTIENCLQRLDDRPGWHLRSIPRALNGVADWLARKTRAEEWSWSHSQDIPRGLPMLDCR
ncbi:hypothetical protein QQ045_000224 [Rhodiola kirilowii]